MTKFSRSNEIAIKSKLCILPAHQVSSLLDTFPPLSYIIRHDEKCTPTTGIAASSRTPYLQPSTLDNPILLQFCANLRRRPSRSLDRHQSDGERLTFESLQRSDRGLLVDLHLQIVASRILCSDLCIDQPCILRGYSLC